MATTADYLNQLRTDKQALVDNLNTQGVPASSNETFTTLVPKVLDIVGGGTDTGAYKVSSVEEMNALTDMDNGDLCVVYSDSGSSVLPSGYTKVEYLQSSGTQYINTNYTPTQNTRVIVDAKENTSNTYSRILSSGAYNSTDSIVIGYETDSKLCVKCIANSSYYKTSITRDYTRHTYEIDKNIAKYDNTIVYTGSTGTATSAELLCILIDSLYKDSGSCFKGNLYSVKVYDNDTLVRDMIPCIRNNDSTAGMYDTVNDVFYTNQGTGTFTVGAVVPTGIDYTIYQYSGSTWVDITDEILTNITITPTTSSQTPTVPLGYKGFSNVTVNAVTSAIDANILPENIKSGVSILGVAGNVEPDKPDQSKTVDPSTSSQTIRPDTGYELASVTVNAVTASIDSNIVAGNIKKDVSILGVLGTLEGSVDTGAYKVSSVEEMNAIEGMSDGDYCIVEGVPTYVIPETATFTRFTGSGADILNGVYSDYMFIIADDYYTPNTVLTTNIVSLRNIGNSCQYVYQDFTNDIINYTINDTTKARIFLFEHQENNTFALKSLNNKYIIKNNNLTSTTVDSTNLNMFISNITYNMDTQKYSMAISDKQGTSYNQYLYCTIDGNFKKGLYFSSDASPLRLYAARLQSTTVDHLVYEYRENSGWVDVTDEILVPQTTITPTTSSQTPRIPDGYRGFKNITVNAVPLETKTVDPSTSVQNITPNTPNLGFSNITVNAVTSNIDPNIMANNIKSGVNILGVQGNFAGIDTSDADATPINIRDGKTAYVNGVKITGNLPVVTYPVDPEDPENWDYQFIAATACNFVTRDNTNYFMGAYQIANNNQPDSWMFEGNRKMKLGIPESMMINAMGLQERTIRKGAVVGSITGTWDGESGEDSGIYEVSSTTEMNNLTTMEEGDLCIVETPSGTLPSGYTEVKYIENQKNAYINTGISASATTQTEMKFCFLDPTNTQNSVIHGIIGGQDKIGSNYIRYVPVYLNINGMGPTNSSYSYNVSSQDYYKPHTLVYNDASGKTYFDGVEDTPSGYITSSTTNKIFVFGLNDTTDSSKLITSTSTLAKIYYLKLKDNSNDTLLRDFIPCIRVSDNAVGLYDKVSNTFFGNEGTGNALMAGPVISTKSVYQYSNGAWSTVSGGPSQEAENLVDEIINGSEEE